MDERLVQWTLLRDMEYLKKKIGFEIKRKVVEEYNTEEGRLDFVLESDKYLIIVELETSIDNNNKLYFCLDQVKRYMNLNFKTTKEINFMILFDDEGTPQKYKEILEKFCKQTGVLLRTYSLFDIQDIYKRCLDELKKTTGEYLGPPVAMDVVYLRWINKVIKPYYESKKDFFTIEDFKNLFNSRTSYGVYTTLAKNFEIVFEQDKNLILTERGKRFRDEYNDQTILSNASMSELSLEQKRILIESLTNGNFTKSKINLYYFLRFVHLTEGQWVPKSSTKEDKEKLKFINFLFGKNYRWTTIRELLSFTCNQCEELGLVERIKLKNSEYDRVLLTTLGSRVLGYLELYLHLKRERVQIPLQL